MLYLPCSGKKSRICFAWIQRHNDVLVTECLSGKRLGILIEAQTHQLFAFSLRNLELE